MLAKALQGGTSAAKTYVDDVFSTYLYDGNSSTQTITNGIDLAGQGGMVWVKARSTTTNNWIWDTARGAGWTMSSNTTSQQSQDLTSLSSFNSNGFSLGSNVTSNGSPQTYAAWTFRKAAKFFDVVTYTGDNINGRQVPHSLGNIPGCILIKRLDSSGDWFVYHRGSGGSTACTRFSLNSTAAAGVTSLDPTGNITSTYFQTNQISDVNNNEPNVLNATYVAYLFAHDTAADGLIQCGSFTTDAGGLATVNLGWEPQWLLFKKTNAAESWVTADNMRGIVMGGSCRTLFPNSTAAETTDTIGNLTPTGFSVVNGVFGASNTYIYIAIRRPNKPPTSGTQVFQPTVYTGTNVDNRLVNTTIAPDMVWVRQRNDTVLAGMVVGDRLRGQPYLLTGSTAAEVNDADSFDAQLVSAVEYGTAFSAMNGFWCGNDATAKLNANTTSNNHIAEAFKRAPGFFDIVCYTGTNSGTLTNSHSLGVTPEMMIGKNRGTMTNPTNWYVYHKDIANSGFFNTSGSFSNSWRIGNPTATTFDVQGINDTPSSLNFNTTYVAYLFASLPGISKVGSYTGNGGTAGTNGTSQTINCGFSAGARFVLIKRTDDTGDWYVFDSARGIVAGNDPYLLTNSTAAEVTTVDAVDADNSGFIVNQTSGTNLNVTNATYIYLAIA